MILTSSRVHIKQFKFIKPATKEGAIYYFCMNTNIQTVHVNESLFIQLHYKYYFVTIVSTRLNGFEIVSKCIFDSFRILVHLSKTNYLAVAQNP